MFPANGGPDSGLGERVFLSADVSRLAGVSLRQLQWWDERKVVSPRKDDHRRAYLPQQVLEIFTVAALRRKGLSLQKTRRVLRLLRRELGRFSNAWDGRSKLYVLTDGNSVYLDDQPPGILHRLTDARKPMYLVCLSDQMEAITSNKAPRRYLTKQLQLF
jgi:DNA-binding transcriptional MerR regulator